MDIVTQNVCSRGYLYSFLSIITYFFCCNLCAQAVSKPIFDTGALNSWNSVSEHWSSTLISNDGNFVFYVESTNGQNKKIITRLNGNWKFEFINDYSNYAYFSADSKKLIWFDGRIIHSLELGTDKIYSYNELTSFELTSTGSDTWALITKKGFEKELRVNKFGSHDTLVLKNVVRSWTKQNFLVLQISNSTGTFLQWVNLYSYEFKKMWFSPNAVIHKLRFDGDHLQVVFISVNLITKQRELLFFTPDLTIAALKLTDNEIRKHFDPADIASLTFNGDGNYMYIDVIAKKNPTVQVNKMGSSVNVWSYKDLLIQPLQQNQSIRSRTQTYVYAIKYNKLNLIISPGEVVISNPNFVQTFGDYTVICDKTYQNYELYWWKLSVPPKYYLVHNLDGSRKLLEGTGKRLQAVSISPDGNSLVYWCYNPENITEEGNWFLYSIQNQSRLNITSNFSKIFSWLFSNSPISLPSDTRPKWLQNFLIIKDNYDLWAFDLKKNGKAINLTENQNKVSDLSFDLISVGNKYASFDDSKLIVSSFNVKTKDNGFYLLDLKEGKFHMLSMGKYCYYSEPQYSNFGDKTDFVPTKARDCKRWIILRQSYNEAPNYFWTNDFVSFYPISNLAPQKNVNWLTAEIINYRQLNGANSQAIVYKPENFDPSKKYPVIFHFYEYYSYKVNMFPRPSLTSGDLNIPWFVSRGYIVCTPDIPVSSSVFTNTTVGERARNSILGARNFLKRIPYIDSNKFALQGHSYGALETNFLVTHTTNLFAAAAEFAGVTDDVSHYLTLIKGAYKIPSEERMSSNELGHEAWVATLWRRPDLYLRNSPVLAAQNVTTPLLITHNPSDNSVQFEQAVELYQAFRRLGKKCWFLEYNDEDHTLSRKENMLDYTIRLTQFFDYYLKDKSPPKWMIDGVPYKFKGTADVFEIDTTHKKKDPI